MTSLAERHRTFFELHQSGCFVVPNPWDMGSARLMAACGAKALATTSSGFAFTLGRPDMGHVTRNEALRHAEQIVAATPLPVTGDLENGFGDDPADVAETVRLAREAGLSGCSIEDTRMVEGSPAYDFDLALERIGAAAEAARMLDDPFVLCDPAHPGVRECRRRSALCAAPPRHGKPANGCRLGAEAGECARSRRVGAGNRAPTRGHGGAAHLGRGANRSAHPYSDTRRDEGHAERG